MTIRDMPKANICASEYVGEACDQREADVQRKMNMLGESVDTLHSSVIELRQRLHPVLEEEEPEAANEVSAGIPHATCLLSLEIRERAREVRGVREMVDEIISRLQI